MALGLHVRVPIRDSGALDGFPLRATTTKAKAQFYSYKESTETPTVIGYRFNNTDYYIPTYKREEAVALLGIALKDKNGNLRQVTRHTRSIRISITLNCLKSQTGPSSFINIVTCKDATISGDTNGGFYGTTTIEYSCGSSTQSFTIAQGVIAGSNTKGASQNSQGVSIKVTLENGKSQSVGWNQTSWGTTVTKTLTFNESDYLA